MAIPVGILGVYTNHDIHPVIIPLPAPAGVSSNVIVNGSPAHHVGNTFVPHKIPVPGAPLHSDILIEGHPTVWCNGKPIAHIGSATNEGALVVSGSLNVFLGEF
jgi:uncharacterized Zn-binding protein involved in type VI secretion